MSLAGPFLLTGRRESMTEKEWWSEFRRVELMLVMLEHMDIERSDWLKMHQPSDLGMIRWQSNWPEPALP